MTAAIEAHSDRRLSAGDRLLHAISTAPEGMTLPALVKEAPDEQPSDILRWIGLARDRHVIEELPPLVDETARRFVIGPTGKRLLEFDPRRATAAG